MGVYIKSMETPKHCLDCPMCDNNDDCTLQEGKRFDTWGEQMDGCPLIEIPEPHGRLIDELRVIDAIYERLEVLRTHEVFVRKHGDIDLLGVMPYIAKIPTVIDAEGARTNGQD